MGGSEKLRFGLALAAGVVIPGFLKYAFTSVGYEAIGTAVWVSGYLTAILAIWFIWIRPLDLQGTTQ
jgi:hypothetical protein